MANPVAGKPWDEVVKLPGKLRPGLVMPWSQPLMRGHATTTTTLTTSPQAAGTWHLGKHAHIPQSLIRAAGSRDPLMTTNQSSPACLLATHTTPHQLQWFLPAYAWSLSPDRVSPSSQKKGGHPRLLLRLRTLSRLDLHKPRRLSCHRQHVVPRSSTPCRLAGGVVGGS